MSERMDAVRKGIICLLMIVWVILAAAAVLAEPAVVATNGGSLNLRKSPDSKAKIVTKIRNGADVDVLEQSDGWAHIRFEQYEGYVQQQYIRVFSAALGTEIYSNGKTVWLRETPDENARIISIVNTQQAMTLTNVENGWALVTSEGVAGYVKTGEIDRLNTEPEGTASQKMEMGILKKKTVLYRDPDKNSEVLSEWPEGTGVSVSSYNKEWSLVKVNDEAACGFARKVSVQLSPIGRETKDMDDEKFIPAEKAKSAAVKALKKYSGFNAQKLICSQFTALSVDGIRGPMFCFNYSNKQGQYVYAAYIHAYTGEVLYTGDYSAFIQKNSQAEPSDLQTADPGSLNDPNLSWCYDENGEIAWSGPTPTPRPGTDIGESAARSVADRYLNSKYPRFSSLTFTRVKCRHAVDLTDAAGFRVPYYQFDYFVDDGSGSCEQLTFEIIIDAYNKEIQYSSYSGWGEGNG